MTRAGTVAVIGLGAWGSAALWQLAKRGVPVVGFEQFEPGHALGSSHGGSRMFRTACLEHSGLVPLAQRSLRLWHELAEEAGQPLFTRTGGLLLGSRDGHLAGGALAVAREHELPVEVLDAATVRRRFPAHAALPDDHIGVWEPGAGLLRPEECVRSAVTAAEKAGARVYRHTRVTGIELAGGGAVVRTPAAEFPVAQVVVTVGAWATTLLPDLPLETVRMPMTWYRPGQDAADLALDRFPVFIRELEPGTAIWGHGWSAGFAPGADPHDVKLGLEDGGAGFARVDPDDGARTVVTPADWDRLSGLLATAVPGVGAAPSAVAGCMKTRTPDGQFLVGRPSGDPRLVVGVGCAGHGFKHATGLGEALADLVQGSPTRCPLGFADPDRFS
ncbi:N-methyl-L-tryptophan oxidase [Couchioplanes azureus]|uniref:N-methyl-L-tryptophan oxidase n=1 Tax=Couchioplanes caeruleus TaxID=56438 RepID=UPI00167102F2|nr:N-methyl-L-tryptophan oxidase [Couchioplanes caeruleus]GGQ76306.1 N-methyltryptophan oxidase [Couchioplanes caeruleus subsp. azureus]